MSAFDSLRHNDQPVAPDRHFTERLRRRVHAAIATTVDAPEIELPERNPMVTTTNTTTPTAQASTGAGTTTLTPYLSVDDAAAAMDWYQLVLGAREVVRYVNDDGRIGHGELDIGGVKLMLADEYPDHGSVSPRTVGGTPVKLNLEIADPADIDAVWERALANGADGQRPPEMQPYGHRMCAFGDPFGHQWMIQSAISQPTDDEIEAGFGGAFEVSRSEPPGAVGDVGPVPVEVGYITMAFDDTSRARTFYGALFGWVTEDGHSGPGFAHISNTAMPMGMTPDGNDAPPRLHFRVSDAAAVAERVIELGGHVDSRADYEAGGHIECVDDQGRSFILWQPAQGY